MKIQSQGASSLILSNKKNQIAFNPESALTGEVDFVALSTPQAKTDIEAKRIFSLPGEFEVSGILATGLFSDDQANVVYKAVIEEIAVVHFGNLKEVPMVDFFEKLGENVDIIVVVMSEDFDDKKAKILIDKIDPRMALILGDNTYFPKMVENMGAKIAEENPMTISKSYLSDDKTDVIILGS